MSRLSIRVRLTLVVTLAMAVVLAGLGRLAYDHLRSDLDATIKQDLETRSLDFAALDRASGGAPRLAPSSRDDLGENAAELIGVDGRVLAATPELGRTPLLDPAQLRHAARRPISLVVRIPGVDERVRLRAFPAGPGVGVVGAGLGDRDDALASLREVLALAAPLALLAIAACAYAVAAFALRPVEAMRLRAERIAPGRRGERLPVPPSGDEIARLGMTLNGMIARLEDGVERERRFVADASHDLRSPLARLKAELELALERPREHAELVAALESAAEEADRLTALTQQLLAMARIEDDTAAVGEIPVGPLIDDVACRYATAIEYDCDPSDAVVRGNRTQLEQALGNLVSNALEHGAGRVRMSAAERDGVVEFTVADEGDGFPEAFLPHAFERLRRGDDARTTGGAGLGLAIVAAVAAAHGGTVFARNRERGAEVGFRLPVVSRIAAARPR